MESGPKHLELLTKLESGEISEQEATTQFNEHVTQGRVYIPKSPKERLETYRKSRELRKGMLQTKVPFMCPEFAPDFWLGQGMTLIGALSGQSKSTTAANLLAGFLTHVPEGQALVISNEDAPDAVYGRISCILQKKSFMEYFKGKMGEREAMFVEAGVTEVADRIEVVEDPTWDTTVLEDVEAILETAAASKNIKLVLLDYLQTVNVSKADDRAEAFMVSKKLGHFLKDFGRRHAVPVVVFAQLKPQGENAEMQSRIQNDRTIYNHAFNVIEIIPDFNRMLTTFKIHKERFGFSQGREIVMKFKAGRYEMDGDSL